MTKLERLQALEQEATKGPWRSDLRGILRFNARGSGYVDTADAALIAALRNAAPDLIRVASWAVKVADSSDALDEERWVIVGLCEAVVPLLESEAE